MNEDRQRAGAACSELRPLLQDYVDQTLPKERSVEVFLHLRVCEGCRQEVETLKDLFRELGSMPAVEPPADFDRRVLASVPYDSYRRMAPLRTPRLPVYLEPEYLPRPVRSPLTRVAGGLVAVAAAAGMAAAWLPDWSLLAVLIGAAPEGLVRLQQGGRLLTQRLQRSELG